ncbi:MauE/DoxX family redox-associated membrane protein [Flagellimonas marinaquae]|uniref:MauE/DoxX family redox-associated membrane protein n=1 Tax=Flagellimonas marinaquae TaxID=254955 RepID=UPI000F8D1D60|nr:MauE/DoxX family redox-associated membrane protein [Allomuricauda aquimarina]
MVSKKIYRTLVPTASFLLVLLFVYTATSKLLDLDTFEWRLAQMPHLSTHADLLQWGVPFSELTITGLLLSPKFRILGLYASFALLGLFSIYIIAVLASDHPTPCSCGGIISTLGWREHILFNGAFMLMALGAILQSRRQTK